MPPLRHHDPPGPRRPRSPTTVVHPPSTSKPPTTTTATSQPSSPSHLPNSPDSRRICSLSVSRPSISLSSSFRGAATSVDTYQKLNRIGEGTYGIVYRARHRTSGDVVALKRIRMDQEQETGMPLSSLREISLLKSLRHENIVRVLDVVVGKGLENIFMADFGLARKFELPSVPMTPKVVTLWYRAPELLLGEKSYTTAVDMWSVGCIFGELLQTSPLLPGKTEANQLSLIVSLLGTPTPQIWPGFRDLPLAKMWRLPDAKTTSGYSNVMKFERRHGRQACGLLGWLLTYDPAKRCSVREAERCSYFAEQPVACKSLLLPM
ncbi:Cyclin-dependent kinase 10 [Thoreauomyces humboldtii]|nr:Cyclin-dependent kinase 10 [Thoreauomyces humboldtii]